MPKLGRGGLAGALLFCIMPAATASGGLALAPLTALCGAIGAPWRLKQRPALASLLIVAMAAWAAVTLAWSPIARPEQALKIALIALAGVGLAAGFASMDGNARGWTRASLLAGLLILALLLAIEAAFDMPLNRAAQPLAQTGLLERNPGRGILVLEILGFAGLAAALGLRGAVRWVLTGVLLAAMAWLAPQFGFEANVAAFVIGALGFGLGYALPKLGPALIGGIWALWLLIAPWVTLALSASLQTLAHEAPLSWGMRLLIWDYAAARIAEKPVLGWGLDAARTFRDPQVLGGYEFASIPLHPHSFSLQVWLETGGVGAALMAAVFVAAGLGGARWCGGARMPAAAATAAFASLGLVWNVSYGAWQEWYLALPFMAAAAVLSLRQPA